MKKVIIGNILMVLILTALCLTSCGKKGWELEMDGESISLPCTLEDMGEGFEYNFDYPFSGNSNNDGTISAALEHNGDIIGMVTVEADSTEDIDEDSNIHKISTVASTTGQKDLKINGIENGASKYDVIAKFGQPENVDAKVWKFTKEGFTAIFFLDESDNVTMLSISDEVDED